MPVRRRCLDCRAWAEKGADAPCTTPSTSVGATHRPTLYGVYVWRRGMVQQHACAVLLTRLVMATARDAVCHGPPMRCTWTTVWPWPMGVRTWRLTSSSLTGSVTGSRPVRTVRCSVDDRRHGGGERVRSSGRWALAIPAPARKTRPGCEPGPRPAGPPNGRPPRSPSVVPLMYPAERCP